MTQPFVYERLNNGTAKLLRYEGDAQTVQIPRELDGHTVVTICNSAFRNKRRITAVHLPETIRSVSLCVYHQGQRLRITADRNGAHITKEA